MKPHVRSRSQRKGPIKPPPVAVPESSFVNPGDVQIDQSEMDAAETLLQLEKVVSEFMITYPCHTQRIPVVHPGENVLISFVRSLVASMASKQDELEKLNQEVLEAAAEKERFVASMSHEVRTPMNGIFGMVNLLLEMDLEETQREYLETIHASSESLLNIVDDILDYAKLNSGEFQLRPRNFDLSRLMREALSVYKPAADKKGINLEATVCASLPEEFCLDDLRLKQVISNLVSNAIKFTDHGGVSIQVQGIKKTSKQQLLFEIKDTGIGISPEAGKTLFSPFRQIESGCERTFEGTGLGLAISKNLVQAMGGRVWFESETGVGTTFLFTVDYESVSRTDEDSEIPINRKEITPGGPVDHVGGKTRVLLVEDNKMNQKVGSLTLQQLGCEVTLADNGKEAVEMVDGPLHFDLICMDVNMPIMNGLEAAEAIRKLDHPNATTRILAMTGMAFEEDKQRCLESGMDDVVTKPFDINDLRSRVQALKHPDSEDVALSS